MCNLYGRFFVHFDDKRAKKSPREGIPEDSFARREVDQSGFREASRGEYF